MINSSTISSALLPLKTVLEQRWAQLPRLKELHDQIVSPEKDVRPFVVALEAIQSEYILSVLTVHAACEALINFTLAYALGNQSKAELFALLERTEFLEKWVTAPKVVFSGYVLDKSSAMYETLRRLNRQRNFYLHNKAMIATGDEVLFRGSASEHKGLQSDIEWIERYLSLPFDLADHVCSHGDQSISAIMLHSDKVGRAPQHKA